MMKHTIYLIVIVFLTAIFPTVVFSEGKVHIVDIPEKSKVFVPDVVIIEAGDTVRWTNNDHDMESHQFASIPGTEVEDKELPIVILEQDKSFDHTFNKPGEYRYFCFVHQGMVGKIIVKSSKKGSE